MGANNHFKAQQFIDVIPGTGGIVSEIAKRVGCSWHTAKKYITTYTTIKEAYDAECESVLDKAENVILGEIDKKDVQTAKWYLTMKGGDRGYAPKQQHDVDLFFDARSWRKQAEERLNHVEEVDSIYDEADDTDG